MPPASYWRKNAREAIAKAVASVREAAGVHADVHAFVAAIDAAYPFGERKYWPYKMWLLERKAAIAKLRPVEGAIDLSCPACGAGSGKPCRDIEGGETLFRFHEARIVRAPQNLDHGPLFAQPT